MTQSSAPTALVLVFDGVEEMEAIAPIDILRRSGVTVTVASIEKQEFVRGRNDIKIIPDLSLEETTPESFSVLVLPGGPGVFELVDNFKLRSILQKRSNQEQLTAAICAAPKVLAAAGLLENKSATSHSSVANAIPHYKENAVVSEGSIVTSQGAGTATAFALKIATLLTSQEVSDEVAQSIHYQ